MVSSAGPTLARDFEVGLDSTSVSDVSDSASV